MNNLFIETDKGLIRKSNIINLLKRDDIVTCSIIIVQKIGDDIRLDFDDKTSRNACYNKLVNILNGGDTK